jgi:predicted metallo-beta-lactamase superfamily hydrolase
MGQQGYRSPWGEDNELRQFRSEIESAMSEGPERFRLTPASAEAVRVQQIEPGFFSRLFQRS